MWALTWRE
ncbi:hypothetical protein F383_17638 [Gossypium arboreum]|uniref:Uncharacterized protein n=1 Tax=Gossypium arboreum TaxID=29729 RepID=A0A0B0NRP1_GOSAR|nr:hypothetical protein F383_17638 [Gossypium arboreum]